MKNQIKQMVCLAIMAFMCLPAFAQNQKSAKSPDDRAKAMTGWMKTNLKLTDDQAAKVLTINQKYASMNQDLQGGTQSKMEKMKAFKANEKSRDAELKGVLTSDQFSQYQAKKEEMKEKSKEKMKEKRNASQ